MVSVRKTLLEESKVILDETLRSLHCFRADSNVESSFRRLPSLEFGQWDSSVFSQRDWTSHVWICWLSGVHWRWEQLCSYICAALLLLLSSFLTLCEPGRDIDYMKRRDIAAMTTWNAATLRQWLHETPRHCDIDYRDLLRIASVSSRTSRKSRVRWITLFLRTRKGTIIILFGFYRGRPKVHFIRWHVAERFLRHITNMQQSLAFHVVIAAM